MLFATGLSYAVWIYLIAARGGFWRAGERERGAAAPSAWPEVVAVIPARDEAETIAATVGSLWAQDYLGALRVVVVDDESSDGTAEVARRAGAEVVSS